MEVGGLGSSASCAIMTSLILDECFIISLGGDLLPLGLRHRPTVVFQRLFDLLVHTRTR